MRSLVVRSLLVRLLLAALLALTLTACLPNARPSTKSAATLDSLSLGSGSASDGAKAPCTRYDTSTATRGVCMNCYNSILSTRCPGKSEFASCIDTTVKTGYVTLVNQCVSQSTQAGFTCTTTCSAGLVLNPANCTCVTAPPVSGSGVTTVDVGQTDFGPPIVRLSIPSASIIGVDNGTSCSGTLPLYMGVQNRGDTVFRLNTYSQPEVSAAVNADGVSTFSSAITPVMLSTAETAEHPGSNIRASVAFTTGGVDEIVGVNGATGGRVGTITTVSGAASDGTTFGDGVTVATAGPGNLATDMTWSAPGFGARDAEGNVYFSEPLAHVVNVICYVPTAAHPFCPTATVAAGKVVRIAGTAGKAGFFLDIDGDGIYTDPPQNAFGYEALLNSPHGVAVDSNHNVYIADSGNHAIRMVTSGHAIFTIIPTIVLATDLPTAGNDATHLNFPYGVDIEAGNMLYVADYQNHRICRGARLSGTCTSIAGNGTPGFRSDTVMNSTAAAIAGASLNFPTDVKINWYGNVLYADSRNHLIRGICFLSGMGDFCNASAVGGALVTVAGLVPNAAGTPQAGDTGEGIAANRGLLTYPLQLLIAKQFADDTALAQSGTALFRDNNIVFTEKLLGGTLLSGVPEPSSLKNTTGTVNNIANMSMGLAHTCFLDTSNKVKCVGNNSVNQIGKSTASNPQSTPLANDVDTGGGLIISGGTHHTCTISASGTEMKCWGFNSGGQLGNATTVTQTAPVTVEQGLVVNPIWSMVVGGDNHTCAFNTNPVQTLCWGNNVAGQLGLGNDDFTNLTQPTATEPVDITGVDGGFTASDWLAASGNFSCMSYHFGAAFRVACWGDDTKGQLGTNGVKQEFPDVPVIDNTTGTTLSLAAALKVAASGNHVCAWDAGGTDLYCWGSNAKGELGIGTVSDSEKKAHLVTVSGTLLAGDDNINFNAVALGLAHTCYVNTLFQVYCWGDNSSGQLGNDDAPFSTVPLQVVGLPTLTSIKGIYAYGNQTCVILTTSTDNDVPYCWGNNENRQIGTPTVSTATPSGNVVRIICGDNTVAQVKTEGFCAGVPKPSVAAGLPAGTVAQGQLYTIAGKSGKAGNRGAGDGSNARNATFGKAMGLTYDLYKNIIVSSGGFVDSAGNDHIDFSLRRIANTVIGDTSAIKYTVTDSNTLSSYWCLRLKPITTCDSMGACSCAMVPPTDDTSDPEFWKSISASVDCE